MYVSWTWTIISRQRNGSFSSRRHRPCVLNFITRVILNYLQKQCQKLKVIKNITHRYVDIEALLLLLQNSLDIIINISRQQKDGQEH